MTMGGRRTQSYWALSMTFVLLTVGKRHTRLGQALRCGQEMYSIVPQLMLNRLKSLLTFGFALDNYGMSANTWHLLKGALC